MFLLTFSLKSLIEILKIKLLRPTGHVVLLPASFAEDDKPRPGEEVTSTCQHPKFRSKNENVRESKWPTWQVAEIKKRTHRRKQRPPRRKRKKDNNLSIGEDETDSEFCHLSRRTLAEPKVVEVQFVYILFIEPRRDGRVQNMLIIVNFVIAERERERSYLPHYRGVDAE